MAASKKKKEEIEEKKKAPKKKVDKKVESSEDLEKTTLFVTEEFQEKQKEEEKLIEKEEKKAKKKERRSEILKEIRAFFILIGSIGLICFGVYYWYTHYYNKNDDGVKYEKVEKQIAEYKTIKYSLMNEKDHLKLLNDKYLLELDKEDTIYKIMDLKSNVLFEGEESFDYIYVGTDDIIYAYNVSGLSYENVIELYKLEDNKFEKVKTLSESGVEFKPVLYEDNGNKYLISFSGLYTGINDDLETVSETIIYNLSNDEEKKIENYYFVGDNELKEEQDSIITYDSKYVIMYEIKDNKKNYGLYDIFTNKVIIEPQYEGLYTDQINYIAIRNGKAGIISSKLKKIVDFQYDFIDRHDDFYVVSKNGKLAIMNDDYKLVSDFSFDYQASDSNLNYAYYLGDGRVNTFSASHVNNNYILSINNGEDNGLNYQKHETYIINGTGNKTISANKFVVSKTSSLIYAYNKVDKKYTIYDRNLDEMYEIDLSEYDYSMYPKIELVNENTIIVHINSDIYFNYETGEEIDKEQNYQTLVNGVAISYDNKTSKVEYKVNNDVVATISVDISEDNVYFKKINDNVLYYNTSKDYVYIEKGE